MIVLQVLKRTVRSLMVNRLAFWVDTFTDTRADRQIMRNLPKIKQQKLPDAKNRTAFEVRSATPNLTEIDHEICK